MSLITKEIKPTKNIQKRLEIPRNYFYNNRATLIIDKNLSIRYSNKSGLALAREEGGLFNNFATNDKIFKIRLLGWLRRCRNGIANEGARLPLAMMSGRKVVVDAVHLGELGIDLALLIIDDPQTIIDRNISGICQEFCLTATESRVLRIIVDGFDTVITAKRLGITPATARTHLQNIFAKTGTSRQSDLVRFVAIYIH
ncbi:helix-turn-helix transcriptional regulator [Bosea sp. 124]|uniref:helix-turn-helix transcriptional regulator n=1 Tax=Bosea sp. 124 TaxID=2135642 RepID=UPI000D4656CD|nr:helix-turn-helix transcriptional regulator [Bosea sp. 124]PTM41154.1 regulatory LuxR family protein [Bosea sp. 124]